MELSLIGPQNAGKTSLVNVVAVGFNMRKVTKGGVTTKLWDLGGQPRLRSSEYVVDAADHENIGVSGRELHDLLSKSSLTWIPLLVLGNKIDNPWALSKQDLTDQMELTEIGNSREVFCFMISCKNCSNIDTVIDWLFKHSKSMD